jgi:hypothetical protein
MMIGDDNLKQLLRIDDELMQLCSGSTSDVTRRFPLGSFPGG